MSVIRKEGFDFGFDPEACEDCGGGCCRGKSGRVWVSAREITQICAFLKTNPVDFIRESLYRIDNRLSIKERFSGGEFECVFLEKGSQRQCSIYAVRPFQCREFPFWDYFRKHPEKAFKACPGVRS